jgi:SagB-type dehydrogenase family enzyme
MSNPDRRLGPMAGGDTARLYHGLSSYLLDRDNDDPPPPEHPLVLSDFVTDHVPTFPAPCKQYPDDLRITALPERWSRPLASAATVLAGQVRQAVGHLDLEALGRVLYLSAGVVYVVNRRDGRGFFFRTSRSAGGLFPLELYVAARAVEGLADGVHWYDPVHHLLVQIGPAPIGEATTIVLTGVPWRTGWRYAERGFRHLYWDAGTTLAQTLVVAESAGLTPQLWTRFGDATVARLVGADGVHEFALALLTLGDGSPATHASGTPRPGAHDAATIEFPLVTVAQRAGDLDRLGDPWPRAIPLPQPPPSTEDLDNVIQLHRSTRVFDPTSSVLPDAFNFSVAAALRGIDVPCFVAVVAVDGVEPGLYRWPDLDRPLRAGLLRGELFRACMDQELARDAAYVVITAIDLAALDDDRSYREAQLAAGIVDGRLHLAAYALGMGASGMTFFDSEIEGLLGEPLGGLLITCVGLPAATRRKARVGERTAFAIPSHRD